MTKKKATHGGARPGAGRPKKYKQSSAPTSIMFEQGLRDRLDKRAAKLGCTRTEAIHQAVRHWLDSE